MDYTLKGGERMEAVYDKKDKIIIIDDNTIMFEMNIVEAQKLAKELNIIIKKVSNREWNEGN